MRTRVLLLSALLMLSLAGWADVSVVGRVVDASGEPLIGVNIL